MRLALFGAPGVGKGTQAKLLVKRLGLAHISTGDLIRSAIRENSEIGDQARAFVDRGSLVPDAIVRQLAEEAISRAGGDSFVLDGYPRTLTQAEWLTEFLVARDATLDSVISISVPDDELVRRISQRRMHSETGEIFHLTYNPPPPDVDAAMLVHRPDDTPEAVRARLQVYHGQTEPLEQYYAARGLLHVVDGRGDIEIVYARVVCMLIERVPSFGAARDRTESVR